MYQLGSRCCARWGVGVPAGEQVGYQVFSRAAFFVRCCLTFKLRPQGHLKGTVASPRALSVQILHLHFFP